MTPNIVFGINSPTALREMREFEEPQRALGLTFRGKKPKVPNGKGGSVGDEDHPQA